MATLVLASGFEVGLVTGLETGPLGYRYWEPAFAGSPAIVSPGRDGSTGYCLELSTATAVTENIFWDANTIDPLGFGQTAMVVSFYFRFKTALPTGDVRIAKLESAIATGDNSAQLRFIASSGKFQMQVGTGTVQNGPSVVAGQWYLVEAYFDVAGATATCKWKIDGVTQTDATLASAASTMKYLTLGWNVGVIATAQYDDLVVSTVAGDYPLGSHKVLLLKPDTGGTITGTNTSSFRRFTSNGTIDASFNSANILAAID